LWTEHRSGAVWSVLADLLVASVVAGLEPESKRVHAPRDQDVRRRGGPMPLE
jgi:hypothetical protein